MATKNDASSTSGHEQPESEAGASTAGRETRAAPSRDGGVLHLVATPIGNLGDISGRALDVLREVEQVLAEDTRHTRRLLHAYGISTPLMALHDFNEARLAKQIADRVRSGARLALVSDAGTPLVSDPGYRLVRELGARGLRVSPVPGPSALLAALCTSGLPTDRFVFEGFPPARAAARRQRFAALCREARTLVLYEAPHRIRETLLDLSESFGADRQATLARELTKRFETVLRGTLGSLVAALESDPDQRKGEMVLVIAGCSAAQDADADADDVLLDALLEELPVKQAARIAAKLTGRSKNALYARALARSQH